jgi:hypothetical protein
VLERLTTRPPSFGAAPLRADAGLVASSRLPPSPRNPVYDLDCRLLPEEHRLEVEGSVRLPAAERDTLTFTLRKDMGDLAFEVIAPAVSAGPAELRRSPRSRA